MEAPTASDRLFAEAVLDVRDLTTLLNGGAASWGPSHSSAGGASSSSNIDSRFRAGSDRMPSDCGKANDSGLDDLDHILQSLLIQVCDEPGDVAPLPEPSAAGLPPLAATAPAAFERVPSIVLSEVMRSDLMHSHRSCINTSVDTFRNRGESAPATPFHGTDDALDERSSIDAEGTLPTEGSETDESPGSNRIGHINVEAFLADALNNVGMSWDTVVQLHQLDLSGAASTNPDFDDEDFMEEVAASRPVSAPLEVTVSDGTQMWSAASTVLTANPSRPSTRARVNQAESALIDGSVFSMLRRLMHEISTMLPCGQLSDAEIQALPKVRFDSSELQHCAICLEVFRKEETLTALQCGHLFHTECLTHWMRRVALCPLCRTPCCLTD